MMLDHSVSNVLMLLRSIIKKSAIGFDSTNLTEKKTVATQDQGNY